MTSPTNLDSRMTLDRAFDRAATVVIGSIPCKGVFQGFTPWSDRSHAVAGAEGSGRSMPE